MGPAAELDRRFEEDRPRLTALTQRVLGSSADAEDAVQDAWVRLSRPGATDVTAVDNLDGWMTRTVSRTCLTPLRARPPRPSGPGPAPRGGGGARRAGRSRAPPRPGEPGPTRAPRLRAPRLVRDAVPRDRRDPRPDARGDPRARQPRPWTRARRATGRGRDRPRPPAHRVDAFFAASRRGDLEALVALLHPEVTFRTDGGATRPDATATVRGPQDVAKRAAAFAVPHARVEPITVNGSPGVVLPRPAGLGHGVRGLPRPDRPGLVPARPAARRPVVSSPG